jgi:DNA-binding transcriptional LysR family regulator
MDFADLEAVVAIAEQHSVTGGADALGLPQPAVSRRLKRLEAEMGGALFVRGRHGASPTPAGVALVAHARDLLAGRAHAAAEVADTLAGRSGRLRLGTTPTLGTDLLPEVLAALHLDAPDIHLELVTSGDSSWLIDQVATGRLDAAFAALAADRATPPGTLVALAGRQDFVVAVPADHAFARRRSVPRHLLAEQRFVTLGTGEGLRTLLDAVLGSLAVEPQVAIEAGEREMLLPLVSAGLGVSLLPSRFAHARAGKAIALRPLTPAVVRPVGVVTRDGDRDALVERFVAIVATASPLAHHR